MHFTTLLNPILSQLLPIFLLFCMAIEIYSRNPGHKLHTATMLLFLSLAAVFLGDFLFMRLPAAAALEVLRYLKYVAVFLMLTAALYFFALIGRFRFKRFLLHAICLIPSLGIVWVLLSPQSLLLKNADSLRAESLSDRFLVFVISVICYSFIWFFVFMAAATRKKFSHSRLKDRRRNRFILLGCLLAGCLLGIGYSVSKLFPAYGIHIAESIYAYAVLAWAYAIRLSMAKYDMLSTAGRRYELLFELSPNGTVVLDERGNIVEANSAFRRLTGVPETMNLQGQSISLLIRDNGEFLPAYRRSFETLTPLEMELELVNPAGERYDIELRGDYLENEGHIQSFFVMLDRTEQKNSKRLLEQLAYEDVLTGLHNNRRFELLLKEMIAEAAANGGRVAFMLIDLDQFKWINDTLGHSAGDQLLQQVAFRLRQTIPAHAAAARLGGDEFAILLPLGESGEDPMMWADRLLKELVRPLAIRGSSYIVSASIGVAVVPDDGKDIEALYRQADTAMYAAKHGGRNRCYRFTPLMNEKAQEQLKMLNGLSGALDNRQFELLYQPQFDIGTGKVTALEALLHWRSPELGFVGPARFLPIAEETGAIIPIGNWVLEEVIKQVRYYTDRGCQGLSVTVNVSASQLREAGFVDRVAGLLHQYDVPPAALRLEMTESTMITDMNRMHQVCRELDMQGIMLGIDDVGSGYSSLSVLNRFPYRYIKLHRSLVQGIAASKEDYAIVLMLVEMARMLGKDVVAEGVESQEQLELLRDMGMQEAQGYHLAMPMNAEDTARLLDERKRVRLIQQVGSA